VSKAIITICGTLGVDKPKAHYEADATLRDFLTIGANTEYTNMLTLLADSFDDSYEIVALATQNAKNIQQKLLEHEELVHRVRFELIENEEDYGLFFAQISTVISEYDETIVDISHGFRHLPIMAIIALIVQNLKDKENIKHILFAKELEWQKRYQIIDLSEYLDIATVSYALAAFNKNYTVANANLLRTDKFRPLIEALEEFGEHILANSIQMIFEKRLVRKILEQIEILEMDKSIATLSSLLSAVKFHLSTIDKLGELSSYGRLFELGKRVLERGYLLNAITILNEALPLYILERINDLGLMDMDEVEAYQKASAVANFISDGSIDPTKMRDIDPYFYCTNYDEVFRPLGELREQLRKLRNDLAHANGAEVLSDVKQQMENILQEFRRIAIDEDIGKKLTLKYNRDCYACKMSDTEFRKKATEVFEKLFPTVGFKKIFEDSRIEKLHTRNGIADTWNLPAVFNLKQQTLIDILYKYEVAKKQRIEDKTAKDMAKEEFYRYFS
jgi:CRISPR-associated DxTHG motif protein